MPELPEVETTVRGLRKKVLNGTFIDVWSDWKKIVKKPADFNVFKKELKGKKIKKIWRRAKNIIFDLSEGFSLLLHQKMTGHLLCGRWKMERGTWVPVLRGPLDEKINLYIHLMFFLDGGRMIALSDLRKFAKVELWKTKELIGSKEFRGIGPEPLEKSFTAEKFEKIIRGKKGKIKTAIVDQGIIAGVGNIYASEALWRAKIHPSKNAQNLSGIELKNLYKAVKDVLNLGIKLGGESFADYRNVKGEKGKFDGQRMAYKREGEKCFRCGSVIKRLKFGGRSSFYCPSCQKI